jgi:hypothetical protein
MIYGWAAILVLASAGGIAPAQQPVTYEPVVQHPASQSQDTNRQPPSLAANDSKSDKKPAETYKPDCANPHNEGEGNFCTQMRQVVASEALNKITENQVLWNKVGAILLLFSFLASAGAAIAAGLAAKHAGIAATYAGEALRTDRAWITAIDTVIEEHTNPNVGGTVYPNGLGIRVKWKNSGRTPALNTEVFFAFRVVEWNEIEIPMLPKPQAFTGTGAAVGPGLEITSGNAVIVGDRYNGVMARQAKVFIYSMVRYFDIFDGRIARASEACFEVLWLGSQVMPDGRTSNLFSRSPRGPQNTAS